MDSIITKNLKRLGLELPTPPSAKGNYLPYVTAGNLVYLSGTLPTVGPELMFSGKVGNEQTVESAYDAAALRLLNALANLKGVSNGFESLM